MDGVRFDALTRMLGNAVSRRDTLRVTLGSGMASALSTLALRDVDAKKKKNGRKKKKKPKCTSGTTRCGNLCTDVRLDPSHCGGCGKACTSGLSCVNGRCDCYNEGNMT
jgi:hypothetical protein